MKITLETYSPEELRARLIKERDRLTNLTFDELWLEYHHAATLMETAITPSHDSFALTKKQQNQLTKTIKTLGIEAGTKETSYKNEFDVYHYYCGFMNSFQDAVNHYKYLIHFLRLFTLNLVVEAFEKKVKEEFGKKLQWNKQMKRVGDKEYLVIDKTIFSRVPHKPYAGSPVT